MFSTADLVGIGIGAFGILVSAVGLGVAIVQLKRIKRTADAVAAAVANQRDEISGSLLLAEAGELERIEADLRSASQATEPLARHLATQAALSWRRTGIDVQAMATRQQDRPEALVEALAESLAVVSVALEDLAHPEILVPDACRSLLSKMGSTCAQSREASGAMILPGP